MAYIATDGVDLKHDSLALIPLGGQSELGQVLWAFIYAGEILLVDAGAAYPSEDLPGVDLLLPNTNFLEANQEKIRALLLTNAHEEHCGAVQYLLHHLKIPKIIGPHFVSAFLAQCAITSSGPSTFACPQVDTVAMRQPYRIGPFQVQWIQVNDAVADACALRIDTQEGVIVYTSSFKLDQTPVDKRLMDVGALAQAGDDGVLILISDSAGVENSGYTPSEKAVAQTLKQHIKAAPGRVIVALPGTNTHRLQILFDTARECGRKVALLGETLVRTGISAAITGNLNYDRTIEATLADLKTIADAQILVIATGPEGDPMQVLQELAYGAHKELSLKPSDTILFSAEISPGRVRQMAMILDQLLSLGVKTIFRAREGIHVSKHGSKEELKLMLSLVKPKYFIPALGEGRHIMHHAALSVDWGMPQDAIFPLKNGEILQVQNGIAEIIGSVESQAVLFNREQGERVTTFSVNERRSLSLEGIVTVSLVVDNKGKLLDGPTLAAGAAGFIPSAEWQEAKAVLIENIVQSIKKFDPDRNESSEIVEYDISALRSCVREIAIKTLRAQLKAKPTVQVIVQEIAKRQSPTAFNK